MNIFLFKTLFLYKKKDCLFLFGHETEAKPKKQKQTALKFTHLENTKLYTQRRKAKEKGLLDLVLEIYYYYTYIISASFGDSKFSKYGSSICNDKFC